MQPSRYLAVRTNADDTWSLFYVVDTATGLAVTTHGTWKDANASAEMANESSGPIPCAVCGAMMSELEQDIGHRCRSVPQFQCSQCKRILPEDAIVGTCPDCRGNRLERIES